MVPESLDKMFTEAPVLLVLKSGCKLTSEILLMAKISPFLDPLTE